MRDGLPIGMGYFAVALYGMFLAIIIPPARQDRAVLVAIAASFALSWAFNSWQTVKEFMGSGTLTIVLTIAISSLMAVVKPIISEEE